MKTRIVTSLIFIALTCSFLSCKKSGILTVNVERQSTGQPIVIADSVTVLVKNTANNSKFYLGLTSNDGVAIFNQVDNGNYEVSSQVWDGSKGLTDIETLEIKNGKSVTIDLLLQ